MRFELMTSSLPRRRSTPELRGQVTQAVSLRTLHNLNTGTNYQFVLLPLLERATRFELATLSLEG
jgi:hypothetical protein